MEKQVSPFTSLSVEETLKQLKVDQTKGLFEKEVEKRLAQYGPNTFEEKEESFFKKIFHFFWGPIPWMIEMAAILSGLLERWPDFILIVTLLLINAVLGFWHEYQAGNAISALKEKLALKAHVLRQGTWSEIPAQNLVPGDIVSIKLGNIVPADVKLLSGEYLSVDQSSLTGESLPVDKKIADMAFSGTTIKMGEMIGVVTETGMQTFFGKTAHLVESAKAVSHFQLAIQNIGRFLIISTLSIAALLLIVSLFRIKYDHLAHQSFGEIAIFVLVLIVSGIPVALPAIMSVTMAIGAHTMAKMKAIVSRLIAIEELAGMDILCSDKTGTLTKNEITVEDISLFGSVSKEELLLYAALSSKQEQSDAIDKAIFIALKNKDLLRGYTYEKFIPFDPVHKKAEATLSKDGQIFSVSKGAPQVILSLAKVSEEEIKKVNAQIENFATKGFRTLGVAKQLEGTWTFLGLISLFDPPREDTKQTIYQAKEMGVSIKMVTGDHEAIAKEVAKELDLGTNILPTKELFDKNKGEEDQEELLEQVDGFAEVFPEHKFNIVKLLQKKGHVVGMTGDGVNDAPALKQADIGIAVSGATDAARSAASLVLTQPGLIVITKAIEEARKIFGRLKSYAMYRISETCRLLLFLLFSILIFDSRPLSAIMIILIALLNDIPIMTIAYDHMSASSKPTFWNMREILTISIGLSFVGVISTFGLYWMGLEIWNLDKMQCSTLAFMGILCGGNLTIYLTRNKTYPLSKPLPEIRFVFATFFSQVVGTFASVYGLGTKDFVGIGWKYAMYSWIYISIWFIASIATKSFLYKLIELKKRKTNFETTLHSHTCH